MITLEEAIAQVQMAGTMKYPCLKKMKVDSFEILFTIRINYSSQYLLRILSRKFCAKFSIV